MSQAHELDPVAECTGKEAFASKHSAMRALGTMRKRRTHFKRSPVRGWCVHPYRCSHCLQWHLGSG